MSTPEGPLRTVTEDDLERLKRQREASDSRYDEALTVLDGALYGAPEFPHSPPAPDEAQVTPLNTRWEVLRHRPPMPTGWRGRIAQVVWTFLEPLFVEQQAFNSLVVDHVNRNIHPQREVTKAIDTTISVLREQVELLVAFHSILLQYLQRITPFVNSKDYEFAALARRVIEDGQADIQSLHRTQLGLTAAIQGLSDEFLKRVESLTARVERGDGRIDDARALASLVQQQAATLQREVARRAAPAAAAPGEAPVRTPEAAPATAGSTLAGDSPLESWKYVGFELAYRGSTDAIDARLAAYVPLFAQAADVLDVGCGRGEFLERLAAAGVTARGVDLNYEMVEQCRARGLEVEHGDALSYLRKCADGSLGGIFAAQIAEHLQPDYLLAVLDEAYRVLRAGAPLVLETINVACWYAFFESYIRDPTHARPLHPETLKYLVTASGFDQVEVQFRVPVPEASRLQRPPAIVWQSKDQESRVLQDLARTVDHNAERLNELLFTSLDYAVVGKKPPTA